MNPTHLTHPKHQQALAAQIEHIKKRLPLIKHICIVFSRDVLNEREQLKCMEMTEWQTEQMNNCQIKDLLNPEDLQE